MSYTLRRLNYECLKDFESGQSICIVTVELFDGKTSICDSATGGQSEKAVQEAINRIIGMDMSSPFDDVRFSKQIEESHLGNEAYVVECCGRREGISWTKIVRSHDPLIASAKAYLAVVNAVIWCDGLIPDPRFGLQP